MANLILLCLMAATDGGVAPKAVPPPTHEGPAPASDIDAGHDEILPELTTEGLRDELRRSAVDRRAQVAQLAEQRARLAEERAQIAQLVKDVDSARRALRAEASKVHAERTGPGTPASDPRAAGHSIDLVTKTLRGMRPDQAALVLLRVDSALAVAVLSRMRPGDSAAILEKMPADRAAQLLATLASTRAEQAATAVAERPHE